MAKGVVAARPLLPGADAWRQPRSTPVPLPAPAEAVSETAIEIDESEIFEVDLAGEALAPTPLSTLALGQAAPSAGEALDATSFDISDEEALDAKLAAISASLTDRHSPIVRSEPAEVAIAAEVEEPESVTPSLAAQNIESGAVAVAFAPVADDFAAALTAAPAAESMVAPEPVPEPVTVAIAEPGPGVEAVTPREPLAETAPSAVKKATAVRASYAPGWRRLLATFLDAVPPAAAAAIALFAVGARLDEKRVPWVPLGAQDAADWWWTLGLPIAPAVVLLPFAVGWLYQVVCFATLGCTLGDRVSGIVWLTKKGRPPGWFRQLLRAALLLPSWLSFGAGYWFLLLVRSHRPFYDCFIGIHPMLRRSVELDETAPPPPNAETPQGPWLEPPAPTSAVS